jgi:hypothetical protein
MRNPKRVMTRLNDALAEMSEFPIEFAEDLTWMAYEKFRARAKR